ncbi:MAG: hypothetical protein LC775_00040 [Acidobacteria bacterium]|nr:hypothetical protein [Acidobacteriota bacterium]
MITKERALDQVPHPQLRVIPRLDDGEPSAYVTSYDLIKVTQECWLTIHILPFDARALPGSDNLVIFGFPRDLDNRVVYVASSTAQRIQEERDSFGRAPAPPRGSDPGSVGPAVTGPDPRSHGGAVIP